MDVARYYWTGLGVTLAADEQIGGLYVNWSATSGGALGTSTLPGNDLSDLVIFDANSGSSGGSKAPSSILSAFIGGYADTGCLFDPNAVVQFTSGLTIAAANPFSDPPVAGTLTCTYTWLGDNSRNSGASINNLGTASLGSTTGPGNAGINATVAHMNSGVILTGWTITNSIAGGDLNGTGTYTGPNGMVWTSNTSFGTASGTGSCVMKIGSSLYFDNEAIRMDGTLIVKPQVAGISVNLNQQFNWDSGGMQVDFSDAVAAAVAAQLLADFAGQDFPAGNKIVASPAHTYKKLKADGTFENVVAAAVAAAARFTLAPIGIEP